MKGNKCNTINLAKVSLDTLKKRSSKLQKVPTISKASFEQCFQQYLPPPPRPIRSAKIQICTPRHVDWAPPPVPCICPPCPICPSRGEQMANLGKLALKLGVAYFLFEVTRKKGLWGPPDDTSRIMTNLSNTIMKAVSPRAKGKNVFGGDRVSLLELDRIKYRLLTWWDKAIVLMFTWTIGAPLQFAHDIFEKVEDALFPEDDKACDEKHHHGHHGVEGKAAGEQKQENVNKKP